jgi:hypothetical protein
MPSTASTFWVDATWRLGRRHQLKFGYTRFSRDSQNYTLGKTFTWNAQVYNAGLSASASVANTIMSAYYRMMACQPQETEERTIPERGTWPANRSYPRRCEGNRRVAKVGAPDPSARAYSLRSLRV